MSWIKNNKGFTLLELLVVVSIILLIASIIFSSLNSSRMKARETKRKQDLSTIRIAIELYISNYKVLPGSTGQGNCNSSSGCRSTDAQPWIPGLVPEFIKVLPVDPINSVSYRYRYRPSSSGNYEIDAPSEIDYTAAENDGGNRNVCPSLSTCRYEIGTDLTRLAGGP